jgi:hypothetical protein
VRGARELVEQILHLLARQRIVRLHRGVTRHGRGHAPQRVVDARAGRQALEIRGHGAQRLLGAIPVEECGHRDHAQAAAAEVLDFEAETAERGMVHEQCLVLARREVEHDRRQQALRFERAAREPFRDLLEENPLVRDVLVHDRDALIVDRDDERVAELAERRHPVQQVGDNGLASRGRRARWCRTAGVSRRGRGPVGLNTCDGRPRASRGEHRYRRPRHAERQAGRLRQIGVGDGRKDDLRCRRVAERIDDRAAQDLVDQALIEESHFRLGRMNVHVHAIGRQLDEEVHLGAAFLDRRDAVGLLNRVSDRAIAHHAAVDEHVLRSAHGPLLAERRDETAHGHARGVLGDGHEVRAVAVDLVEALLHRARRRRLEQPAVAALEPEADLRIAERDLRDEARHLRRFGRVRLEEFPPRGQVEEDLADLDERAFRRTARPDVQRTSTLDAHLRAGERSTRARAQAETRDRRNRRQRLAAEAERVDGREIGGRRDLARRVPLDRQLRVLGRHPLAVVFDEHKLLAAELDGDADAPCARVDGVLDELLDDRGRSLDDLAGGNLVRQLERQPADARHSHSIHRNHHIMAAVITVMKARIHQNCPASPPGQCGSATFIP